ncbi:response regulator [Vibrio sp. SCSIO 43136]|uniref:response regulator n=1 Tax=Vibrio sp. SCSIO 43136 TaxID=2819101 RepID=UPI002074FF2E|nr:response regulator [Vibrio sp. SCSIO 43136]USD63970.1 response regulator [Vibrio sp. SCSIO 43136]
MNAKSKTILVVDDTAENRTLLTQILKDQYRVLAAVSGLQAIELCERFVPDMVLLDIVMPMMDGYEVCRRLQNNPITSSIPVVFLTAKNQIEDEQRGFNVGAVDYIQKPISPPILLARVNTHLKFRQAVEDLENQRNELEQRVRERTKDQHLLQRAIMVAMASLADAQYNNSAQKRRVRTQKYVKLLAENYSTSSHLSSVVSGEIPLNSRLMVVAEVYESLTSDKVSEPPLSHEKAVEILLSSAGSQFDPEVIEAFLLVEQKLAEIAKENNSGKVEQASRNI